MTRAKLPDRRSAETFLLDHTWAIGSPNQVTETIKVTVGRYGEDGLGPVGEVFLECDNHHNQRAVALWHDLGVVISFALQHGATIPDLCAAMARGEVNVMGKVRQVAHSPAGTVLEALLALERAA